MDMKITQAMPIVLTLEEAARNPGLAAMCTPVTDGTLALAMETRVPSTVRADSRHHPRRFSYRFPALTRARAHSLDHPDAPATTWTAAALYGFGTFSDGADSCLLRPGRSRDSRSVREPTWRRLRGDVEVVELAWEGQPTLAVSPEFALARCVQEVLTGCRVWDVPGVPGLAPPFVRAVQLVDAYRFADLPLARLPQVARGKVDARVLARVVGASDAGAESPRETILRLLLDGVPELNLESQVPVYSGNRLVTRFDLADRGRGIGFMYDGAHHGGGGQWKKDAEITLELKGLGWTVIRVVSTMLDQPERLQSILAQSL